MMDNVVMLMMVVFFAAMLVLAAKAVLTGDSTHRTDPTPNTVNDILQDTPHNSPPASVKQSASNSDSEEGSATEEPRIWTSEHKATSAPLPVNESTVAGPVYVGPFIY